MKVLQLLSIGDLDGGLLMDLGPMLADIFRLVVGPLIGGLRLPQQFFGVRAMPEQRHNGDQHCQNRHRHRNWRKRRIMLGMFGMFLQFVQLL